MSWEATAWALQRRTGDPTRKAILLCLANAHNAHSGWCSPDQARLAEEAEVSVRTLQRHLAQLEADGIIRRERQRDAAGYRMADRYELIGLEIAKSQSARLSPRTENQGDNLSCRHDDLGDTHDAPRRHPRPAKATSVSPTYKPIVTDKTDSRESARDQRPVPVDFHPSDAGLLFALQNGLSENQIAQEAALFREHHRSKGTLFADLDAGWRTWVLRTHKYDHRGQAPPGGEDPVAKAKRSLGVSP